MFPPGVNHQTLVVAVLFLCTCQGALGDDSKDLKDWDDWNNNWESSYNPPSMGLILGLTFGSMLLFFGLTALCFYCPICCWYKMRNSRGVVTYTNARPVPGGVATVTPQHPYPYPAGVIVHQQGGQYPPGTQGQVFSQGPTYVQGAPYHQGGIIYPQGNQGAQGPFPYPQGTVITPQNTPQQQGQPPPYHHTMK